MIPREKIESIKGKVLWSVIAGEGTGSTISLGFGDKKTRKKKLANPALSEEERNFEAEYELLIYCAWRVLNNGGVVCSWCDSNLIDGSMLNELELLKGQKVLDVQVVDKTYDLKISFENKKCFEVFCDQTNDEYTDENYIFFTLNNVVTVGLKSILQIESR